MNDWSFFYQLGAVNVKIFSIPRVRLQARAEKD